MTAFKNKYFGLILALTIAFSTLLPFFATYNTVAPSKLASLLGEKILICTGDGFALVNRADLQSGKAPIKPHKDFVCPLCYVAANGVGVALLPATTIFLALEKNIGLSFFSSYQRVLKPLTYSASSPRAPPFSSR